MVNVVRNENAEVGMHSNVIFSLIDPNGLHYQGDLFLQYFIKDVIKPELEPQNDDFGKVYEVQAEESTSEGRRIDFTIKSSLYYIGIEMKINAGDLDNQIFDYVEDLKKKADLDSHQKVLIYYLTIDGKKAKKKSHNGVDYKQVSFDKHILNWIENCQKEVRNITNLNESFENYKNIVKKITGKYERNIVSLKKLLEESDNFELARDISEAYKIVKAEKDEAVKKINFYSLKKITETYGPKVYEWDGHWADIKIYLEKIVVEIRPMTGDIEYLLMVKDKVAKQVEKNDKESFFRLLYKINKKFQHGKTDNEYGRFSGKIQNNNIVTVIDSIKNMKDI